LKKVYNKLVRDKIPDIIAADGKKFKTRILNKEEHLKELIKKLTEEAKELEASPGIEELADIKELVISIRETLKIRAGELEEMRRQKAAERGRFKKQIFLIESEE